MALTDEELIELAKKQTNNESDDTFDLSYFQELHNITNGKDSVLVSHLYYYYSKWSIDPVTRDSFLDMLQLDKKDSVFIFLNKDQCSIDFNKLIGEYVKKERKLQKKERLGKVSGFKSKT